MNNVADVVEADITEEDIEGDSSSYDSEEFTDEEEESDEYDTEVDQLTDDGETIMKTMMGHSPMTCVVTVKGRPYRAFFWNRIQEVVVAEVVKIEEVV